MSLARPRCAACTMPLGDPPHQTLPIVCGRCGQQGLIVVAADGQPVGFDVSFTAARLLGWFAAARQAMAFGALGTALGACARCDAPLTVPPQTPTSLPCPHCAEPVVGTAADVLVDQWPEPWTKVDGGGLTLEYRLAIVDAGLGEAAGCASCGAPTLANDPSVTCRRCHRPAWVQRPDGKRVQLGVRVNGVRQRRPFKVLVPIVQGEMMLRGDVAASQRAESGSSLLGLTGVGCAIAIALAAFIPIAIAILVYLAR